MARILAALAILLFCGAALAQFGGSRRGGQDGGMGRQRPSDGQLSGITQMSSSDRIRMQLTDARLALKLEPEQNPLFDAYQEKVTSLLPALGNVRTASESPDGDAMKQIERKVAAARSRAAALDGVMDAARKLYAVLSAEQKTVADRVLPGTVPAF